MQVDLEIVKKWCVLSNSYPISSSFFMNASNKKALKDVSLEYGGRECLSLYFLQ